MKYLNETRTILIESADEVNGFFGKIINKEAFLNAYLLSTCYQNAAVLALMPSILSKIFNDNEIHVTYKVKEKKLVINIPESDTYIIPLERDIFENFYFTKLYWDK